MDSLNLLKQHNIALCSKVEVLNDKFQVIDEMTGTVISGDCSTSAESDNRRTYNISVLLKDKSYNIESRLKVWHDKFIRIYEGQFDNKSNEIIWQLQGTFSFCDISYNYDSVTASLDLNLLDFTALLDGTLNGYSKGRIFKINEGANIRNALISLITQEGKLSNYRIVENKDSPLLPYDMEFSLDDSTWKKITDIRDLYPAWESFFDIDGTFVFQPIPTCIDDDAVVTEEYLSDIVISEPSNLSFSEFCNVIDLYGQMIESDRFTKNCTTVGANYAMQFEDSTFNGNAIPINTKIEVVVNSSSVLNQTMSFNNGNPYPIILENGTAIKEGSMIAGTNYVLKYRDKKLIFLGEQQVHAICKELAFNPTAEQVSTDKLSENCNNIKYIINPNSHFAITSDWKNERRIPLSSGEYENIYSNDLATQRAEYELWKRTRLIEKKQLTMINIATLDVNKKIEQTSQRTGETKTYITKKIHRTLGSGIMTVDCIEFYPLYPFIIKK